MRKTSKKRLEQRRMSAVARIQENVQRYNSETRMLESTEQKTRASVEAARVRLEQVQKQANGVVTKAVTAAELDLAQVEANHKAAETRLVRHQRKIDRARETIVNTQKKLRS